ncbi:MAG: ferredoxin family protein [Candidatus Atribacteria bacterium]|nr:ferredoxin family protein [Candidatus Atribacteria bacterium]
MLMKILQKTAKKKLINTLEYKPGLCINCGMCSTVCPHGVFQPGKDTAKIVRFEACMECGACQLNCSMNAIKVESGVGCAKAMILAALLRNIRNTKDIMPFCIGGLL